VLRVPCSVSTCVPVYLCTCVPVYLSPFLPLPSCPGSRADDGGGEIHPKHEDEQDERRAVLDLDRHLGDLRGDDKQVIRKRHGRVERGVGEARQKEGRARKQDRRGLARGAFEAEDNSRQDARQRLFQDDAADRLPTGRADRDADRAERLRDGAQGLLRGADDDGDGHDRESQRGGQDAGAELEEDDKEAEAEKAVHHRGDARQVDDGNADEARPLVVGRVLGEIDRRRDSQRDGEESRAEREVEGADDGGQDPTRAHSIVRKACQEFPRDGRAALAENVDHDDDDRNDSGQRHKSQRAKAETLEEVAGEYSTVLHRDCSLIFPCTWQRLCQSLVVILCQHAQKHSAIPRKRPCPLESPKIPRLQTVHFLHLTFLVMSNDYKD